MFEVDEHQLKEAIRKFGTDSNKWKEAINSDSPENRELSFEIDLSDGRTLKLNGTFIFETLEITIS